MSPSLAFARRRRLLPCAAALSTLLAAAPGPPAAATPAPQSGHRFPPAVSEALQGRPDLYLARDGLWVGKVRRAREVRERFLKMDLAAREAALRSGAVTRRSMAVTGTIDLPVVPLLYSNTAEPPPLPTPAELADVIFEPVPDPARTSVADYYHEISYGNVTLAGRVFPYQDLPRSDEFYEDGQNGLTIAATEALVRDAVAGLDPSELNPYDTDGDGEVDMIIFLQPEPGGECSDPALSDNVWTHFMRVQVPVTPTLMITNVAVGSVLDCDGSTMKIGTFAHEVGHLFGLPDLYDRSDLAAQQAAGIGWWGLMGNGNWIDAHMSAWSKAELGWLVPENVTTSGPIAVAQAETQAAAFRIEIAPGEYFLIENRQQVGFDQNLPGCGLAIWHVDAGLIGHNIFQNCGSYVEATGMHYRVALEQPDGRCQLEDVTVPHNRGDAGDLHAAPDYVSFGAATTPGSHSYKYEIPTVEIRNVSACGPIMTADVELLQVATDFNPPLDFVFLVDNTSSFGAEWQTVKNHLSNPDPTLDDVVAAIGRRFTNVRFGLAIFRDFPFSPYGDPGDFAYRVEMPLTGVDFHGKVHAMPDPSGGGRRDLAEAQYEAIYQVLTGSGLDLFDDGDLTDDPGDIDAVPIEWDPTRHLVIYVVTDSGFHNSDNENYPTGTSDVPPPVREARGRDAVYQEFTDRAAAGEGVTVFFVLAKDFPGQVVTTSPEEGTHPGTDIDRELQAEELAALTGGAVLLSGSDSSRFLEAVEKSLDLLGNQPLPVGGKDLEATMPEAPPATAIAGSTFSYRVTSSSIGTTDVEFLALKVPLQASALVYDAALPSADGGCLDGGNTVTCAWTDPVPVGESRLVDLTVRVCPEVLAGQTLTSTATAWTPLEADVSNNTVTFQTTAETESEFTLAAVDAPDPVYAGGQLTYTLDVVNVGPSNAAATAVTLTLPPEFTFVSATSSGVCGELGGVVTCTLDPLGAPGQCATSYPTEETVIITAAVAPDAEPGVYTATADLLSGNSLPDLGETFVTIDTLVRQPILEIPTLNGIGLAVLGLSVALVSLALLRRRT